MLIQAAGELAENIVQRFAAAKTEHIDLPTRFGLVAHCSPLAMYTMHLLSRIFFERILQRQWNWRFLNATGI